MRCQGLGFEYFCVRVLDEVGLRCFFEIQYFCGGGCMGVVLSVDRFCELRTDLSLSFDTSLRDVIRSSSNGLRPVVGTDDCCSMSGRRDRLNQTNAAPAERFRQVSTGHLRLITLPGGGTTSCRLINRHIDSGCAVAGLRLLFEVSVVWRWCQDCLRRSRSWFTRLFW